MSSLVFTSYTWEIYDIDLSAYLGQTVEICFYYVGSDGAQASVDAVGINAGYTPPEPPVNNECAGAIEIPCGPFTITDNTGQFGTANNYDPSVAGCTGFSATGPDLTYYTYLEVGDVFTVTMATTGWDDSIYLVRDCNDVDNTCVAGADDYPTGSGFTYTATEAGIYYLIADGYGSGSGGFTLTGDNGCTSVGTEDASWGQVKGMFR